MSMVDVALSTVETGRIGSQQTSQRMRDGSPTTAGGAARKRPLAGPGNDASQTILLLTSAGRFTIDRA
jgi:hypothetical protein